MSMLCYCNTHYGVVGVLASFALMMNRGKRMENRQPLQQSTETPVTSRLIGFHQTTKVWPWSSTARGWDTVPDDVRGRKRGEQRHGQTKAKVIGPVPLDVGQPLVHLHTSSRHKEADVSTLQTSNRLLLCVCSLPLLNQRYSKQ